MHSRWKPEREAEKKKKKGKGKGNGNGGGRGGEDGGKVKSAEELEQTKTHSKRTKEQDGTSTNQENKQEQHLPIRHAGRPVD